MDNSKIKALWKSFGGGQHGPHIETMTIPESGFYAFCQAALLAAEERGAQRGVLWCCHVRGPDDLYAAESYDAAMKHADDINDALKKHNAGREPHPYDPIISAVPAPWPWDAESHAEAMRKFRAHASTDKEATDNG